MKNEKKKNVEKLDLLLLGIRIIVGATAKTGIEIESSIYIVIERNFFFFVLFKVFQTEINLFSILAQKKQEKEEEQFK